MVESGYEGAFLLHTQKLAEFGVQFVFYKLTQSAELYFPDEDSQIVSEDATFTCQDVEYCEDYEYR
jgi:hypothetical protein